MSIVLPQRRGLTGMIRTVFSINSVLCHHTSGYFDPTSPSFQHLTSFVRKASQDSAGCSFILVQLRVNKLLSKLESSEMDECHQRTAQ